MGLFDAQVHLTDVEKVKAINASVVMVLKNHALQSFNFAWKKHNERMELVIKTKEEVQAFFDELGVDGAKALQAHAKEQELLHLVSNWDAIKPPYEFTVSKDGKVTIL